MRLLLDHPEVATRPCECCLLFMYEHKTGKLERDKEGKPVRRPPHSKAPCQRGEKESREVRARICPKISPNAGVELNEQNKQALEHYYECRATNQFESDPIVRRNAAIIREFLDAEEARKLREAVMLRRR